MDLTVEQRCAINHEGNVALVACPGSGKTRTLVAKAAQLIDTVRGSTRKIACITYTNAASREVESRLKALAIEDYDEYVEITTIHSFCLINILHHFYWLVPEYRAGYEILPPDSDEYRAVVRDVIQEHGIDGRATELFEQLNREPNGAPVVRQPLTAVAAKDFWSRLQAQGYIDFANIVYYSYRLMMSHSFITRALAARFAVFLVDEFQDTSALQVEILSLVANYVRTKFFLVGDLYQSIYGFAGAHPELFDTFADRVSASREYKLLENWRSSPAIIEHAERLCPRIPPMRAVGGAAAYTGQPVYVHAPSPFEAITDYFLPGLQDLDIPYGKTAVLAPWWITLLRLGRQLREYGIPILGPGARPYRRHHLIAPLAEELSAYCEEPDASRVLLIERELFWLVSRVAGANDFTIFTYHGRRIVWRLLALANRLREVHAGAAVAWLRELAQGTTEILHEEELLPRGCSDEFSQSVEDMIEEMGRNNVDTANLAVPDLGMFARSNDSIRLLTMHGAKGLEFDAVAIVDLHDGRVPHFSVDNESNPMVQRRLEEEGRRLLYVALTRAKRFLMYATDQTDERNRPSRFMGDLGLRVLQQVIVIRGQST